MFKKEEYDKKIEEQEQEIENLKLLLDASQQRATSYQAQLEEDKESEQIEEQLINLRNENRLDRERIKEMEEKYRQMVEKWRHNDNIYTKVSHNFKFEFLPRLAAEREDLKSKIDKFRNEQECFSEEANEISHEIAQIEQNNKELRLRVEELTFEQRCLKSQISKQDEVLAGKQSELNRYQSQITEATESQTSVLQQIKVMRTMKDRTEKKLKWGLNDLKEAQNTFSVAESRLVECYASVTEKVEKLKNFRKDLFSCLLEECYDSFIDKFSKLINSYGALNEN